MPVPRLLPAAAAGDVVCQLATGHHVFAAKPTQSLQDAASASAAPPAAPLLALSPPLDLGRTAQLAAFQILMAPIVHEWYGLLAARGLSPLKSMLLDQGVFAPFGTAVFLAYLALVTHSGAPAAYVVDKLGAILLANWLVWPAVQLANFAYMPLRYRVLVGSAVGFAWSIYLSFATH